MTSVTVDTTVEVEVDEILSELSTDTLREELERRDAKNGTPLFDNDADPIMYIWNRTVRQGLAVEDVLMDMMRERGMAWPPPGAS